MRVSRRAFCLLPFAFCLTFGTACRHDMQDTPRYEAYEPSDFFKDGLSSRTLVEGTVPRGYLREDRHLYTGKKDAAGGAATAGAAGARSADAQRGGNANTQTGAGTQTGQSFADDVDTFPFPVTREIVDRGQERYQIFCAMCHGDTGAGDGMVVRRGFRRPPSYHTDQLREAPVGHFYDVITNGWGAMPSYAAQIPVHDRWAIVAYVRALQLSQQGAAPAEQGTGPAAGGQK